MVDLTVYVDGARHLTDGTLYDFFSEPLHLPFTYPPFSAIIFTPMTWLTWTLLRVLWQLASFGAHRADGLLHAAAARPRRAEGAAARSSTCAGIVVTATALGLWLEPVRTTFNYGQINLFLARAAARRRGGRQGMAGRRAASASPPGSSSRPAITGPVLPAAEALVAAVVWSVVFFAGTVAHRASPSCRARPGATSPN